MFDDDTTMTCHKTKIIHFKDVTIYTIYHMTQNETVTVYVDGRGGDSSGYGYYAPDTGESDFVSKPGLTNMEAEYAAILHALEKYANTDKSIVLYSDSQTVVRQINHEYSIKKDTLRDMARNVWLVMKKYPSVDIQWVRRGENPAGKMLG